MVTLPDLLYVALFAVGGPLWDYLVSWPAQNRQSDGDPALARKRIWIGAIVYPWLVVAVGVGLWLYNDRSRASLGFSMPSGWPLWVALGLVALLALYNVQAAGAVARDAKIRESVRQQMFGKTADVMPHTRTEMYWFGAVSLTAGFCEEFLYRGYFIWALTPWLGWWGAAALSLVLFAIGHAYQGVNGVLRTGIVGALFTLLVAIFGSLWPAIVLHFLLDLGMGIISWFALREGPADHEVVAVEQQA